MVIATHTEVEVRVQHFRLYLVKVEFEGGHHIVVGGRLLSSCENGVVTPHPDMPEYTMDMFPVDFNDWSDEKHPEVRVVGQRSSRESMRPLGCVRACTMLFTPREKQAVTDWIRSQR